MSVHRTLLLAGSALNRSLLVAVLLFVTQALSAQQTVFTYQGELLDAGVPANGAYDFRVRLHDSAVGGIQLGSEANRPGRTVNDGVFTLELDFGTAIYGTTELWLEMDVRASGQPAYTPLAPRFNVAATPHAVHTDIADDNSVDSDAILDNTITAADIGSGQVRSVDVSDGSLSGQEFSSGMINTVHIVNGSIAGVDIDNEQVQPKVQNNCEAGMGIFQIGFGLSDTSSTICRFETGIEGFSFDTTLSVEAPDGSVDIAGSPPVDTHLCLLSKVHFRDIDGSNENAICRLEAPGTSWRLAASSDNDSDAFCEAICLTLD